MLLLSPSSRCTCFIVELYSTNHRIPRNALQTVLAITYHHIEYYNAKKHCPYYNYQVLHLLPPAIMLPKSKEELIVAVPFSIIPSAVLFNEFTSPRINESTIITPKRIVPIIIIKFFILSSYINNWFKVSIVFKNTTTTTKFKRSAKTVIVASPVNTKLVRCTLLIAYVILLSIIDF